MKITKKQIKELHQSGDVSKLREWYPSVFGEELEVGVWYYVDRRQEDKFKALVVFKGHGIETYGFNHNNTWTNIYGNDNTFKNNFITKATHQEIEAALINEAKKRGYKKGVKYLSAWNGANCTYPENLNYNPKKNCLSGRCGNNCIFQNGTWATIIKPKQMTQEQIEKELGYKIEIV